MNKLDKDYIELCKDIINNGVRKNDRTGTGTLSVFSREIRHLMSDGFPLLTNKKMAWKQIVVELLWFLKGDTNIKYLVDNNCYIWVGDVYKNYEKKFFTLPYSEQEKNGIWIKNYEFNSGYPTYELLNKEEFINKIKTDDNFSNKWGELGPTYGKQWTNWNTKKQISIRDGSYPNGEFKWKFEYEGIDQIQNLIDLLKTNPDSRRLLVSAWNVEDIDKVILPPCHYGFQCYTRQMNDSERYINWIEYQKIHRLEDTGMSAESAMDYYNFPKRKLSLKFNMRSTDFPLGFGFNIASYALLLEILANECNMISDEIIGSLGDVHIYLNQLDGIKEQLTREPFDLPRLVINKRKNINEYEINDFKIEDYKFHPTIKMPLSN